VPPALVAALLLRGLGAAWTILAIRCADSCLLRTSVDRNNDGHPDFRIVYFAALRGPDVEARHKVLWFFGGCMRLTMFAGAIRPGAAQTIAPEARAVIQQILVARAAHMVVPRGGSTPAPSAPR
jgi:hypothetical protein